VKQEIAKASADGFVALTASLGVITVTLKFFDHYAAGIGAICTLIFGVIYIIFQFMAHKKLTLADNNEKRLDKHEEQLNKVEAGINTIIEKLNTPKN